MSVSLIVAVEQNEDGQVRNWTTGFFVAVLTLQGTLQNREGKGFMNGTSNRLSLQHEQVKSISNIFCLLALRKQNKTQHLF